MRHRRYDHLILSDSPNTASLLALIGDEKLAQLSLDFGGAVISIPLKVGENSPIAYSIGLPAAQMLSDIWGGMQFTVPLGVGKTERILRLISEGRPINKITRIVGVSRSTIYRIIAAEEEKNQLDLF
ncbi:MAG: helix-turn-helix domain-containing protein [Alphaproteobacteria bacterium]|nr:helix-turn-helix domain-containing protein [Alphaproteobacteria bacterium]